MSDAHYPKKLIEVALPLDLINVASAREKSIRHGHPSTLHLWWARRPLAAARAVLFAQLVDDPSSHPELFPTEESQHSERERLFRIIEDLVVWENTTNQEVLERARAEIKRSWELTCKANSHHPQAATLFDPEHLPAFHDPFAGGGAIPLEAQRLGLESYASDLNPVAVLINKAMIEIPPRFSGLPPINPEAHSNQRLLSASWRGAQGLANDVRYYGTRMKQEAQARIGRFYPSIEITDQMISDRPDLRTYLGRSLTPIAYLWARTVKSPNPAFSEIDVPLVSSFAISTKAGKEAWVDPVIRDDLQGYDFVVRIGTKPRIEGTVKRSGGGTCLLSGTPMPFTYLRQQGQAGRMGDRLMAIVCEGDRGRVYLSPTEAIEALAREAKPSWKPELELPHNPRNFNTPIYGLTVFADLFTPRQLLALTTFSDLVSELAPEIERDAIAAGLSDDGVKLNDGGKGAKAYAEAVGVYLGFSVDRLADRSSNVCSWVTGNTGVRSTFGRQAIAMTWDYAESNPFSDSSGSYSSLLEWIPRSLEAMPSGGEGWSAQADAQHQRISTHKIVSTDPPYYDNIGYADLSDFFYTWLRHALRDTYPDLFATLAVPKSEELVATPYRHGSKDAAEAFFLAGMTDAMGQLASLSHPGLPVTIYYAFKQSETDSASGTASTGWETFLEAVVDAGFAISGTWPMRTELSNRMVGRDANALASSIVLVCRPRPKDAPIVGRSAFLTRLRAEFPSAFARLQEASIAPVDLAQSAIGPGMAIYTSYGKVESPDGSKVGVREALSLINQVLDETLAEQEGDFEPQARWAIAWFDQFGFDAAEFGIAETLSKAKNTSVATLAEGNVIESRQGRVRLLRPSELDAAWDPKRDSHISSWEVLHQIIRVLESVGEAEAGSLVSQIPNVYLDPARELAYRLYVVAERKSRAQDALSYNTFVQSWPELLRIAQNRSDDTSGVREGLFS